MTSPSRAAKRSGMDAPTCRLYLITPPALPDLDGFARELEAALDAGDVAALQIRLKGVDDAELTCAVKRLAPLAQARGVAVILNDRPDLVGRLGCDGAHIGQEDAPYAEARRQVGRNRMIGVSCHDSRHLAMDAAEQGADYVAFGAFFETGTKEVKTRAELELLSAWQEAMEIPCVAIGGITVDTAETLAHAGADFLAVSAGVWRHHEGPTAAVRAFNAAMAAGVAKR